VTNNDEGTDRGRLTHQPYNGFARVKCKDCGHEYLLGILLQVMPLSIDNHQYYLCYEVEDK